MVPGLYGSSWKNKIKLNSEFTYRKRKSEQSNWMEGRRLVSILFYSFCHWLEKCVVCPVCCSYYLGHYASELFHSSLLMLNISISKTVLRSRSFLPALLLPSGAHCHNIHKFQTCYFIIFAFISFLLVSISPGSKVRKAHPLFCCVRRLRTIMTCFFSDFVVFISNYYFISFTLCFYWLFFSIL